MSAEAEEVSVQRVDDGAAGDLDEGLDQLPDVVARRHVGAETREDAGNGAIENGSEGRQEAVDGIGDGRQDSRR